MLRYSTFERDEAQQGRIQYETRISYDVESVALATGYVAVYCRYKEGQNTIFYTTRPIVAWGVVREVQHTQSWECDPQTKERMTRRGDEHEIATERVPVALAVDHERGILRPAQSFVDFDGVCEVDAVYRYMLDKWQGIDYGEESWVPYAWNVNPDECRICRKEPNNG